MLQYLATLKFFYPHRLHDSAHYSGLELGQSDNEGHVEQLPCPGMRTGPHASWQPCWLFAGFGRVCWGADL